MRTYSLLKHTDGRHNDKTSISMKVTRKKGLTKYQRLKMFELSSKQHFFFTLLLNKDFMFSETAYSRNSTFTRAFVVGFSSFVYTM